MTEVWRFSEDPHSCPYIPRETACNEHRIIVSLSLEEYDALLARGWRRRGNFFFRPKCPACSRCISLHLPVPSFRSSKSQRRIERENSSVRLIVKAPTVSKEHLDLWNAYHRHMQRLRGWPENEFGEAEYAQHFISGEFEFSREFLYYDGDKLIGVGLVDVTSISLSSVYFFHNPALRSRGLGVFSMLTELNYAREHGFQHAYLGYWINENASMGYKSQYKPHELLVGLPEDDTEPVWKCSTEAQSSPLG